MNDLKETGVNFTSDEHCATFFSSERKWINKLLALSSQYPDDVQIVYCPEDNHGMLVAHIPKTYLKISPPRKREMTDEQREAAAVRLAEARAKRNG